MRKWIFLAALLCAAVGRTETKSVEIAVLPEQPVIELGRVDQRLNFDFLLVNRTGEDVEIGKVELSLMHGDALIEQRRLGWNGESVLTLPQRKLAPGATIAVFNPFYSFDAGLPLERLVYRFEFDAGEAESKYATEVTVRPRTVASPAMVFPVEGRVLVHDGHDFLSHHRRLDVTGPMTTALGIRSNLTRYAYDFCVIEEGGRMYRGDGASNEEWYGFGTPIHAPRGGRVAEAVDGIEDNTVGHKVEVSREALMANPKRLFGNYVLIDHGDGSWSLLAHLKQGSVKVKAGDPVREGQVVGGMGMSGDAFLVHLHYELQTAPGFTAEGLPSYFKGVELLRGAEWVSPANGSIDSGDVVRRKAN